MPKGLHWTGENVVWDDLRIPIGAMILEAQGSPPSIGVFVGSISVLLFDPDADEEVFLTLQLPHSYKYGTKIIPHVHWAPTNNNTGNVIWGLEYQWRDIGQAFSGASTTVTATQAGSGTTGEHQLASFGEVDGGAIAGNDLSSMVTARLFRDADNIADTYTGNAALLEFDIHFQIDVVGSRLELTK